MKNRNNFFNHFFVRATQKIIAIYRILISPFFGNCCRFVPSCSEYADQAIAQFGIFRGAFKTSGRLFRCHPFHPGGYDPVSPR